MAEDSYVPTTDEVRLKYESASLGQSASAEFDRWLAGVKADAIREHEKKRVVLHMDPPQPRLVPVPAPCPRCGWSR